MKENRFLIIILLLSIFSLTIKAQSELPFFEQNKEYIDKIVIVFIGALLGFLFNYINSKRKERQGSKQLSYDLKVDNVIVKADKELLDNIKLKYKSHEYESLSLVTFKIQNTGKKVVKNEMVRIEFDKKTSILDEYFTTKPEPELNFESLSVDGSRKSFERTFNIGHLVKNKKLTINFVVTGDNPNPKIHDKNEDGDVEFIEGSISKVKQDREIINDFLIINMSFVLLIPLSYFLTKLDYSNYIVGGFMLIFILFNLLYIKRITRIISEFLFKEKNKVEETNIQIQGDENLILHKFESSDIDIKGK